MDWIEGKLAPGETVKFYTKLSSKAFPLKVTAFVIGMIAGLPRWRSGCVYGSIILHSLINRFGR